MKPFKCYLKESAIQYQDHSTGYSHGESFHEYYATENNIVVGIVTYGIFQNQIHIKMVEVSDKYQSQGIGQALIVNLLKLHRNKKMNWGSVTASGEKLKNKLIQRGFGRYFIEDEY